MSAVDVNGDSMLDFKVVSLMHSLEAIREEIMRLCCRTTATCRG